MSALEPDVAVGSNHGRESTSMIDTIATAARRTTVQACIVVALAFAALAAMAGTAQAATPGWKVLAVTGPTNLPTPPSSSERQQITTPFSGTYTLGFGANTTPPLASNASAATIQAALNALPSISAGGGSVSVAPGPPIDFAPTFIVTFDGGPLAGTDVPMLVYTSSSGGSVGPVASGTISIHPFNVGGAPTSGSYTATIDLPVGITTSAAPSSGGSQDPFSPWSCGSSGAGQSTVSCTRSNVVFSGSSTPTIQVPVAVSPGVSGELAAEVSVSGGGATAAGEYVQPITVSDTPAGHGVQAFFAGAFDENGNPETRAGAHPNLAMAAFLMNTVVGATGKINPAGGDTRQVDVDLPAGFVANPLIAPRCPRAHWFCGGDAWVGHAGYEINAFGQGFARSGLSNMMPPDGSPGQVSFRTIVTRATVTAKLRPDDYGIKTLAENIVTTYKLYGSFVTLWGRPGSSVYDNIRCSGLFGDGTCESDQGGPGTVDEAFITNPMECSGESVSTLIGTFAWQNPGVLAGPVASDSPPVTDCGDVPFEPSVSVTPTSSGPDSASGVDFDLTLPQDGLTDPDAIATSHLKDVSVDLPEGVAVNPSAATGLEGCSDAQMQVGSDSVPQCPDGSKLGTVEITSPLVDRPVGGTMYLATPKSTDPMSGEMLRLWVVARNDELGVMVKLPGSATADPQTGKLTATFENNPQLPFDHLTVKLKGGDRGVLAMPQDCGAKEIAATLSPWSGTVPVTQDTPFNVDGNCSAGFGPELVAGMDNRQARGNGTFSFKFSRQDGEQWIDGLTATLPTGLLASVKGLPLCTDGQAAAGACPAGSRIGTVDATAGSGNPFVLEQKGSAFLTEGYKGCSYGLAVVVPVIAGPFDGTSPETDLGDIVVRQSVCVDRSTAQVTVVSDPLPTIWHGIPVRVRSVTVNVDRPAFMLNPSDCAAKQVGAAFHSADGATSAASNPFNTSSCGALPFKPTLALSLTGRKQVTTGKHPGVKALVTQQGVGEAGIEKAVVRLPKSLALDVNNAQALCEFVDGTKPDLENRCPKGSIVGRARAVTPLLNEPLTGNVYFVKNVRKDPVTGNEIRTLPMIVVALRGEIAVNLYGKSSTTKSGKLVNTFDQVPDAPISQFNLNIQGGNTGILAVTRTRKAKINLCAGRHVAEADMDAQNGRRHDFDIRMKTPCTKKQAARAKRAAAKRARAGR